MKANELRIGNLVTYENKIHKIFGISEQYPFLDTIEYGAFVVEWYDLKPIPLTEEWLFKFGFKKVKDTWITIESFHYENKNCWIYLIENGFEFELITLRERHNLCKTYKFVHELQNLYFALTGEELVIA